MCQSSRWWAWLNIKVTSTLVTFSLSLSHPHHPLNDAVRLHYLCDAKQPFNFFSDSAQIRYEHLLCTDGEADTHTYRENTPDRHPAILNFKWDFVVSWNSRDRLSVKGFYPRNCILHVLMCSHYLPHTVLPELLLWLFNADEVSGAS